MEISSIVLLALLLAGAFLLAVFCELIGESKP
jgi:hypothetical protein